MGERYGVFTFPEACWEMVSHQRFVLVGMTLGSVHCHRNHHYYKSSSLGPKSPALTTNTKTVPNCTCCHGLLLCQTLLGISRLLGTLEFISSTICCRDFTYIEISSSKTPGSACILQRMALSLIHPLPLVHEYFVLQGQLFFLLLWSSF